MIDYSVYPVGTKLRRADGEIVEIDAIDSGDAYPFRADGWWYMANGTLKLSNKDKQESLRIVGVVVPLRQELPLSTLTTLRSTLETLRDAYQDLKIEFTRTPDTGYSGEAALKRMCHEADLIQQALELLDA